MNWKRIATAFTTALTFLAAAPYSLGDISLIVPTKYKPWVFMVSGLATLILHTWYGVSPRTPPQPNQNP